MKNGKYNKYIKRPADIFLSTVLLVFTAPIMLLAVLSIFLDDGRPILFLQERLGRYGELFDVYKFRSMKHRRDMKTSGMGAVYENDETTQIGKWLRRFRIDEIPQLLSVISGEMSLVGPRPCLPERRAEFDENGEKTLFVRPGCSGLAQVQGNDNLSWEEKWKYDAYYVDNISFIGDMRIITKTIAVIILGEDYFTTPFSEFINKNSKRH